MFREGFVWGSASSSYQIEGAAREDGRGLSVWDEFCDKPGAVLHGHTGAIACDHYHRMPEDVAMMRDLGMRAYRFSIAWPRVMPEGRGRVNPAGLGFYDRLVDELLAAGIEPWATLFHWDFPYELQLQGGWLNRESARWFAEYTRVVVDRLSDRVKHWMTINEPQVYISLGHGDGTHAPGLKLSMRERLLAGHHTLLAHGEAVQVIRAAARQRPFVGWAPVGHVWYPATEREADIEAARKLSMSVHRADTWNNTWWSDPVCRGAYPEDGLKVFGMDAPRVAAGDMETICQPLDFYGVNIYQGTPVEAGPDGQARVVTREAGFAQTAFKWPIAPESLYWGPRFIHERYGLPIVITENGLANLDWPDLAGRVADPQRIDFTRRYLLQLARASREGIATGYFHWSIMDNFEWAEGYQMRFGLVHVDFQTLKRTPKDSAYWYRDVIRTNGASLLQPASATAGELLGAATAGTNGTNGTATNGVKTPQLAEMKPPNRPAR
jgi:beta-glucosidase